jgi:hypothetical protein
MTSASNATSYDEDEIVSLILDASCVRQHWYELLHRVETEGLWVFITHRSVEHQGARIAVLVPYSVAPGAGVTIVRRVAPRSDDTHPVASLLGVRCADHLRRSP